MHIVKLPVAVGEYISSVLDKINASKKDPGRSDQSLLNSPIIIHHHDGQTDLFHVLRGNVEDDGLVVRWIKCAFLGGGFSLLQPPSITYQVNLNVRIWETCLHVI